MMLFRTSLASLAIVLISAVAATAADNAESVGDSRSPSPARGDDSFVEDQARDYCALPTRRGRGAARSDSERLTRQSERRLQVRRVRPEQLEGFGCTPEEWASLVGDELIEAIATSSYTCLRPLFDFDEYVAVVVSEENIQRVNAEMLAEAADLPSNAGRLTQFATFFHIAYYHEWYEDAITYSPETLDASQRGLAAIAAHPAFLNASEEMMLLREAWSYGSYNTEAMYRFPNIAELLFDRFNTYPSLGTEIEERRTLNNVICGIAREIYNDHVTPGSGAPWETLMSTPLLESIGRLALKQDYTPYTMYLTYNSLYLFGNMSYLGSETSAYAHEKLSTAHDMHPHDTAPWFGSLLFLEQYYDSQKADGTVIDCEQLREEIKARLFPDEHQFDEGSLMVKTALPLATVDDLYNAIQEAESQFFRLCTFLDPVSEEPLPGLTMIIYSSPDEYELYHPFLYKLDTDNGGMYIEQDRRFFTYERTPADSIYTLEELTRHEYVHYLDAIYLKAGLWGQSGTINAGSRMIWHSEGLAEYLAGSTQLRGVPCRRKLVERIEDDTVRLAVDEIVGADYSSGFKFYRYAGMLFSYLHKEQPGRLFEMLDLVRDNSISAVDAFHQELKQDVELQTQYSAYLDAVIESNQTGTGEFAEDIPTSKPPFYLPAGNEQVLLRRLNATGTPVDPQIRVAGERFVYSDSITVSAPNQGVELAAALRIKLSSQMDSRLTHVLIQAPNFAAATAWFGDVVVNGNSATAHWLVEGPYNPATGSRVKVAPVSRLLAFGDQEVDDANSTPTSATVLSCGTEPLNIAEVSLAGPDSCEFVITSDSGEAMLPPGQCRLIELAFVPTSIGGKAAALVVVSDDLVEPSLAVNLTGNAVAPNRLFVDCNAPQNGDGSEWSTAFNSIQAAIDGAISGAEVWVADGTYSEIVTLKEHIEVYGGFTGLGGLEETHRSQRNVAANEVVIDAQNCSTNHVVVINNATHVRLDGFTVTGGNANGEDDDAYGGGIFCYRSNATNTIANCTIRGNSAVAGGGGIYCYSRASPAILSCSILENSAKRGAGIYFRAHSTPLVADCVIEGNSSGESGGGAYCYDYGAPALVNCLFRGNSAGAGAAMYCTSNSSPTISNCSMTGNRASQKGGGLYCPRDDSNPTICNCILWGNEPDGIDGTATVNHSCVQGGWAGTANISLAPSFVDAGQGDLHLSSGSPCIDCGTNDIDIDLNTTGIQPLPPTDRDGLRRRVDNPATPDCQHSPGNCGQPPIVDMGAYEFGSTAP